MIWWLLPAWAQEPADPDAPPEAPAEAPAVPSDPTSTAPPLTLVETPEGLDLDAITRDVPTPARDVSGDSTMWTGKPVVQVSVAAPNGGLGREDLTPLLHVRQDAPYSPYDVRQDIILLYRIGDFSQVEAVVEPWVAFDEDGNPMEAVRLEYRVWSPPHVERLRITGNKGLSRREIIASMGVGVGDPWREEDPSAMERTIEASYTMAGWSAAKVDITVAPSGLGEVEVEIRVDEGAPHTLVDIAIPRQDALPAARVRSMLAAAGVKEGQPLRGDALGKARDRLLTHLRRQGWYEANVTLKEAETEGGSRLLVVVDPRRKWHIVWENHHDSWWPSLFLGWAVGSVPSEAMRNASVLPYGFVGLDERPNALPGRRSVIDTLGLENGVRLTRYFGDDAGLSLSQHEAESGFVDAKITAQLQENPGDVTLTLSGSRGLVHVRKGDPQVEGDAKYSARFLRGALRDGLPAELRQGWGLFGPYRVSPAGIDEALSDVESFYRAQGYADVRVSRTEYTPNKRRGLRIPVQLGIKVEAGPQVTVSGVALEGAIDDIVIGTLLSDLIDKPFDPSLTADRARQVVALYREAGYLGADASVSAERSADGTTAALEVAITAGPPVYVRGLLVKGYRRTRRSVIAREVDLAPGDLIRPSSLARIRKGLYDLSVFSRVSVDPSGDEDRVKDLVVTVEEQRNLFFEIGGGVATDDGIKLTARAGHRNLWGLAHRLTGYGEVGLGWVGDGFGIDQTAIEWEAGARYEAPHIPGRDERAALDVLFNSQQQEPAWRIERTGFSPSVQLRVGSRTTARIGYGLQWRRLLDVDPGLLVPGDPWLDDVGVSDLSDPHPTLPSATRIHSGLDMSMVFDLRNDTFNPTKGGIGTVSATVTDGVISDVLFLKADGSWTQFVPVGAFQLLLRGRGGAAWVPGATQSVPIEERFQLGGTTFRGFLPDGIGPASEVSPEYVDFPDGIAPVIDYESRDRSARWVPTGGDATASMTVEFQLPFSTFGLTNWFSWQLALFTDIGNVWWISPLVQTDSMTRDLDPLLRYSVGLGIRRVTPIGPIAVDLGFNPSQLADRDESLLRLHVSLGAL